MRNVLKRIYELMSFFVRFLVFEIWSILYSTFVVNIRFEPENLNQKRKPVIPENQLDTEIQTKRIRCLGAPHKNGGSDGRSPLT